MQKHLCLLACLWLPAVAAQPLPERGVPQSWYQTNVEGSSSFFSKRREAKGLPRRFRKSSQVWITVGASAAAMCLYRLVAVRSADRAQHHASLDLLSSSGGQTVNQSPDPFVEVGGQGPGNEDPGSSVGPQDPEDEEALRSAALSFVEWDFQGLDLPDGLSADGGGKMRELFDSIPKPVANSRVILKGANPFKLGYLDGEEVVYPTFSIDWEQSTLDVAATIASMKAHRSKLDDTTKRAAYIWPYFMGFRLLDQQTIFADPELIEALYVHYNETWTTKLTGDALAKAVKEQKDGLIYFHCTKDFTKNLCPILGRGEIAVTNDGTYGGAFAAVAEPEWQYGRYALILTGIEKEDLPLSHIAGLYQTYFYYWAGFWNPINLKKTLKAVVLPDDETEANFKVIKNLLRDKGYNKEVKVMRRCELVLLSGDKLPRIVPAFWPVPPRPQSYDKRGYTFCRKTHKGTIAVGHLFSKDNWQLYINKKLKFASFKQLAS